MQETMASVIDEIRGNTERFLLPAQNTVEAFRRLFRAELLRWDEPRKLERYMIEQLRITSQLDGIYYADRDGRFLMVKRARGEANMAYLTTVIDIQQNLRRATRHGRDESLAVVSQGDDPANAYDPRSSPWYKKALAQKEVIWTDPYVFFASRQLGITTAAPVFDEAEAVQGVVGVDIEIGKLSEFLAQHKVGRVGAALIINRQGEYIAHSDVTRVIRPSDTGLRVMTIEEVADPAERAAISAFQDASHLLNFAWLEMEQRLQSSFDLGDDTYHVIYKAFPKDRAWPWIVGVHAAEHEFIGPMQASERYKMITAIIISIGITILAFLLASRFIQPVVSLREEVERDTLTRIHNRLSLFDLGPRLVKEARQKQTPLSIIVIDVDEFKLINDEYGHSVGDETLIAIVNRLKRALNKNDTLARYAGDEFVVLLPGQRLEVAGHVAERLRLSIGAAPVKSSVGRISVTVSLGIAELGAGTTDFDALFDEADRALRAAKQDGRNNTADTQDFTPSVETPARAVR